MTGFGLWVSRHRPFIDGAAFGGAAAAGWGHNLALIAVWFVAWLVDGAAANAVES